MVGGVLYASNAFGLAEAFNPSTGATLWVQKPGPAGLAGSSNRSVAYWGTGADARIITYQNRLRWTFHVIPRRGDPAISTWEEGSWQYTGAGNVWAPMSADDELGYVNDLIDFTPELRAEALAIFKQHRTGPVFTPPSVDAGPGGTRGTIEMPGSVGGADWTGAAFDPDTGLLYVPSMTNPFVANLVPGRADETDLAFRASSRALLQGPRGLPLVKPPYGRITALDLNRGELTWTVANGDGPRNHPLLKPLSLPPLGQAVRAGPLVTKTLLFVTEGDQINVRTPPNGGGKTVRAFDKATGKVLWAATLEAGSTGTPMTYMHNGKQFLVFAIGATDHAAECVAFSLP